MKLGDVMNVLVSGTPLQRGETMFLCINGGSTMADAQTAAIYQVAEGTLLTFAPFFQKVFMEEGALRILPWTPTAGDITATDWLVPKVPPWKETGEDPPFSQTTTSKTVFQTT